MRSTTVKLPVPEAVNPWRSLAVSQSLVAAALIGVSAVAMADNISIYGILDTAVASVSNSVSSTGHGTTSALTDGLWLPSLFGIKGSEDLGNGMKANLKLEGNLNTTNGEAGDAIYGVNNGKLFDRWAMVGLSGNFGEINAGEQIDPLFLQSFLNGVRQAHSASLALNGQLAYGTPGNNTSQTIAGVFTQNMVTYKTPVFSNTTVQIGYVFGGTAGSMSANSGYSALINYDARGLALNAGYELIRNSNTPDSLASGELAKGLLGGSYVLGDWKFAGQVNTFRSSGSLFPATLTSTGRVDSVGYEVGVGYSFTPSLTGVANYVWAQDNVNNVTPTVASVSLKYDLSKRTNVYVLVDRSDSKTAAIGGWNATYNDTNNLGAYNGQAQNAFVLGVSHSF